MIDFLTVYVRLFVFELVELVKEVNVSIVNKCNDLPKLFGASLILRYELFSIPFARS